MANFSTSTILSLLSMTESATGLSPIVGITIVLVSAGIWVAFFYPSTPKSQTEIHQLGSISVLTTWSFFTRRYDFLWANFKATREKMFRFNVLHHSVVAMKGEEARKAFFSDKSLDFVEGYRILMGGSPDLKDIDTTVDIADEGVPTFIKRLLNILRKDRLTAVLPVLFEDVNRRMLGWGKEGKINPFKQVYDLVFQMTVRMATCSELADDEEAIAKLAETYWKLEKSATPVALLLPWFPGSAKRAKQEANTALFTMLSHYVDMRKKAGASSADTIDILIQDGCDDMTIIQFVLRVIFAGVINTGISSCWGIFYLGANPEWRAKITSELQDLMEKYSTESSSEPMHKRLASIPISAWEDEMPAMDLVIRETLRLAIGGTALRRNISGDITADGKVIKKGDFLAYSLADVHHDPAIYPDPLRFNPSRYEPGREEDKKGTWSYLGWGAGRHPCAGMKVAKLEIKVILAMFMASYEFELVDEAGKYPKALPHPNWNNIQQATPVGSPCYVKFKRIMD